MNGRGPGPARSTGDGGFRCTSTLGRCATGAVESRAGKPPGADGHGWSSDKCVDLDTEGILEVLRVGEVALVVLVLGEYHLPIVSPLDHVKRIIR